MPQTPDRHARILLLLVGLIILAGAGARLYQIGYNFDGDELFSVSSTSGSFRQALGATLADRPHPPLYYLLLWAWLKLTGPSEVGARLLSVLASTAFLVVLWRLASRLVSPAPALMAVFLCALSPFFVSYGQHARMYALIPLLVALNVFFLLRVIDEPSTWRWALLWGASSAALLYTQYLGALLLLPQLAAIAIRPLAERRRLLIIGIFATASILPWVAAVRVFNPLGLESPLPRWIQPPDSTGLVGFFVAIFGWGVWQGTTRILIALSAITLLSLAVRRRSSTPRHLPLVLALAAFPPAVFFFVSRYSPVSIWAPRQMIGSAVFVLLLVDIALSLHRRWIGAVLAAGFATWIAMTLSSAFPEKTIPPWRTLGARLQTEFASPVVGEEDWVLLPLRHYSTANIRHIADYPSERCCGSQLTFVCRPFRCTALADLRSRYKQVAEETVQWSPDVGPTSTLKLYVFRQSP